MGWIRLHKKLIDWGWYSDGNTLRVFLHLLLTANFKPTEYLGRTIERGQAIFGRKALAEKLGISEQSVRTAIFHLQSTNELTITSTKRYSVATLVNYSKYQCDDDDTNQRPNQWLATEPTNSQPTANQQLTTSEEYKKKEEDNVPPVSPIGDTSPRGESAPEPKAKTAFKPPTVEEVAAYCRERCNSVVAQQWHDHYTAKGWMIGKNKMKDWKAAVRTWEKNRTSSTDTGYRRFGED